MRDFLRVFGFCCIAGGLGLFLGHSLAEHQNNEAVESALLVADSAVAQTKRVSQELLKEQRINEVIRANAKAQADTVRMLRRELRARVYPKRRAQLDSLTSPLTATPDDVRAWLKQ